MTIITLDKRAKDHSFVGVINWGLAGENCPALIALRRYGRYACLLAAPTRLQLVRGNFTASSPCKKKVKANGELMMNKRISVLLIEDEEHIRRVLQYNLNLDGFEVHLAKDGLSGLELAVEQVPDLILLDWMMPGMDGLEVLSKLKQDKRTENIPVFMLTAKGMMADVGRALYEGADDYITKPFDPTQLGKTLRTKLRKYADSQSK